MRSSSSIIVQYHHVYKREEARLGATRKSAIPNIIKKWIKKNTLWRKRERKRKKGC